MKDGSQNDVSRLFTSSIYKREEEKKLGVNKKKNIVE